VITQSQVNHGKDTCSFHLVEHILDLGERILVLNGHFIKGLIVHANLLCSIFLFHEQHGCAPQVDQLGRINPFNCNLAICFISSTSSFSDILSGLLEIGVVPDSKSIMNLML
jgi:hypothetical protein